MPRSVYFTRSMAVLRLRHQLEQRSFPRIQMAFIVTLTGGFGLLFSSLLLHAGMASMALRYPLALAGAYISFLGLLWMWLRWRADDFAQLGDLSDIVVTPGSSGAIPTIRSGAGGDFVGGGASGSFDAAKALPSAADVTDADELAIPLLVIVLALGLALASLYVVYLAPALFAELLLDGVLSYGLYHRLRDTETSHWLMTALRRTVIPFLLTAIFLAIVGTAMAVRAPGARSIGEFVRLSAAR